MIHRIVELDLVGHPLVVDVGTVLAQHHVLGPVGEHPAGRSAGLDADAQRRGTVGGGHLVDERLELFERGRDLVAVGLEQRRLVVDDALQVGLGRDAVLDAVDLADDRVALDPVLVDGRVDLFGDRDEEPVIGEVGELAGLREERDVGRVAALDLGVDVRFPVGVAGEADGQVLVGEVLVERVVDGGDRWVVALGTGDRDGCAAEIAGCGVVGTFVGAFIARRSSSPAASVVSVSELSSLSLPHAPATSARATGMAASLMLDFFMWFSPYGVVWCPECVRDVNAFIRRRSRQATTGEFAGGQAGGGPVVDRSMRVRVGRNGTAPSRSGRRGPLRRDGEPARSRSSQR